MSSFSYGSSLTTLPPYAGSLSSYTIYIDSTDNSRVKARNNNTGAIDYKTASAPANSADTTTLFNNVFTALQTTGGTVFLKAGVYSINNNVNIGKSDSSLLDTVIIFSGEGRDNTIIRYDATATSHNMIQLFCVATVERITLDGNNKGQHMIHCNAAVSVITTQDCALINGSVEIMYWTGSPLKAERILRNYFGKQQNFDQCASGVSEYSLVDGNTFDKRGVPVNTGSSKTYGGGVDVIFTNNIVQRLSGDLGFACSIEGWGSTYNRVILSNNTIENGQLFVGGQNVSGSVWNQVMVEDNNIYGGFIRVDGGNGNVAPANEMNRVTIAGNQVFHSWWGCIMLSNIQGPVIVTDNLIGDSNQSASSSANNRANISISYTNNTQIYGNTLHMLDTTSGVNIWGIWQDHAVNAWIHDNIIVNSTSNAGYSNQFGGGGTNIQLWDNQGYLTNNEGSTSITGNGSTTAFTIAHGLAVTPNIYFAIADTYCYVSSADATNITVTFPTAPSTGSHTVNWRASKRTGF